ncbi:MAG TPA: substrate-binding domain-containing protein [Candidatus Cybelea sp.]|nr:substrate-binding domain-containing protein [Candidatus Cybelea sp.]
MKRLRVLLSLTNYENDYQIEQAGAAEEAARRFDMDLEVVHADNDSVNQSKQLLDAIQQEPSARPDAILFEPVGSTGLPQVALAAAGAGITWVVLNCEVRYIAQLRTAWKTLMFEVSSDHTEIGRIQGRQLSAILPEGGSVLYIQGPSDNLAAKQRTVGMNETRARNIHATILKGQWTEASAERAVSGWLRLSTSQRAQISAVAAQDDSMAIGARRAFEQLPSPTEKAKWLSLPFLGCDGLPKTGQSWVRSGVLAATIVIPPNTPLALETLAKAIGGGTPSERILTTAASFPSLPQLASQFTAKPALRR